MNAVQCALRCVVSVAAVWVVARAAQVLLSPPRRLHKGNTGTACLMDRQVLNRIVAMLPDAISIVLHAKRRTAVHDDCGGFKIVCFTSRLGYQAQLHQCPFWGNIYSCDWDNANGRDGYIFDLKGRLIKTAHIGYFPAASRYCSRFALQRMCHRLVQRTRRRIQCRQGLDPYLIPELVNIATAYC